MLSTGNTGTPGGTEHMIELTVTPAAGAPYHVRPEHGDDLREGLDRDRAAAAR
jgi:hypothetical protein